MKKILVLWMVGLVGGAFANSEEPGQADAAAAFHADELAPGVHLFRPVENSPERTNSLVVEQAGGLLVVEAQPTPEAARAFLAALAEVHPGPIRYLVLSHPHAEAAGGASAFPESTLVVGSAGCHASMIDPEYDFGAEQRQRAGEAETWVDPPRRPPTLTLHANAQLQDPRNPVKLTTMRPGHSRGDLAVELSEAGILYVGSLVFPDRNPYPSGRLKTWVGVLNNLATSAPPMIVPLRGAVMDVKGIRQNRTALAWLRGQVNYSFVEMIPPERIPDTVMALPDLGTYFDTDPQTSFIRPMIEAACDELRGNRQTRGLDP